MTSASSDSTGPLVIANQFLLLNGPFLVATNVTWLVYGCCLIQIYQYYSVHSAGDRWLKHLVSAAGLAATLHIGFVSVAAWKLLVEHWGDADIWVNSPWELGLLPFTNALNGIFVQLFFVTRIIAFSKHILARTSAGIISLAALLAFCGSIAIAVTYFQNGTNVSKIPRLLVPTIMVWGISTAVCDVMIAVTMIIILRNAHSQTSFKRVQSVLTRLIIHSIETGTVTAVNMLLYLIFYKAMSSTTMYGIPGLVSGPLYGNVLVYVLNSRQKNRAELSQADSFSFRLSGALPGGVASGSSKVTTESDNLSYGVASSSGKVSQTQYNAYATEIELNEMGVYGRTHSETGICAQ